MLDDFFTAFPRNEARSMLHKMFRSAFARKDLLDKEDVLNLLHLKEQMNELIKAAGNLCNYPVYKPWLVKLLRWKSIDQWAASLDETFHAAVFDGFFIKPPADNDIYYSCRGLLHLVAVCSAIHEHSKDLLKN